MAAPSKLDSLPRFERDLLEAISVAFFPANRTTLNRILKHADIRNEAGNATTTQNVAQGLEILKAAGWVEGDDRGYSCKPAVRDAVAVAATKRGSIKRLAQAVRLQWPPPRFGGWWNDHDLLRDFRLELLLGSQQRIESAAEDVLKGTGRRSGGVHPFVVLFSHPEKELVGRLPDVLQLDALRVVLQNGTRRFENTDKALECLQGVSVRSERERLDVTTVVLEQTMLRGKFADAEELLAQSGEGEYSATRAWLAFLRGRDDDAVTLFRGAMAAARKQSRAKKLCLPDLGAIFFPIALQREGSETAMSEAIAYTQALERLPKDHPNRSALERVGWMQQAQSGANPDGTAWFQQKNSFRAWNFEDDCWAAFIGQLCALWLGVGTSNGDADRRLQLFERAVAAGFDWVAAELAVLITKRAVKAPANRVIAKRALFDRGSFRPCADALAAKAPWQTALEGLSSLAPIGGPAAQAPQAQVRLAWILEPWANGFQVEPVEQKRDANGQWTRGRPVALRRLVETPDDFAYLTQADRGVCSAIQSQAFRNYGYTKVDYFIDSSLALPLLRNHPAVFMANALDAPVEISVTPPSLCAHTTPTGVRLTMTPALDGHPIQVFREGPTRLRVVRAEDVHRRMANLVGAGLDIPSTGLEQVSRTLSALAEIVAIEADVDVSAAGLRQVAADGTPRVHLVPSGAGFRVRVVVSPLGGAGPAFRPGAGPSTLIGERDGERVCAVRDHDDERRRVAEVIAACPSLDGDNDAGNEWLLTEPEAACSLLLELVDLGEAVIVEWPRGQSVRAPTRVGLHQLRLSLRSADDWFALDGELRVDEDLVLGVRMLVEAVEAHSGRFVPIGEGRMLALSEELRQRIRTLAGLGTVHRDSIRLHPLAAVVAPEIGEGTAGLGADKAWKARARRVAEAMRLEPAVPTTLQAELRPYQVEGFQWLVRLAHVGAGACLADDMGLGKTLEALAVALTLAHKGPILVVAPTSVCFNWVEEASKFAPTLRARAFGPGDRKAMLASAAAYDLIVCSYGLLFQELEALGKVRWAMVVLDEAQAIKNPETKRSMAAMSLDTGFRLAMTGTPIENRLDDLWSLLRVINPGLLGSQEAFRARFANPIERDGRKDVALRLKKIVQPFLLRRTKAQVLADLPARTEITRKVELSDMERATYEALRRSAVEQLAGLSGDAGQAHIVVLTALTKLRRACCHARLAVPDAPLASSKLEALGEILDELRDNHHKALVFSQFVGHLELVREFVVGRGLNLQYLDGSTPPAERKRSVEAFQNGQGDVFLISLKAGGFGLNLTAADYVIHMDPWWNPAVEDQASDRAHRIGQTRPVTVYRLVAANTIEEKILRLHSQKRELADRLLEGSDQAARVSLDEMLSLLREPG